MHVMAVAGEGETVLGWGYEEPDDGGKATNQSVAAARLGAPVVLITVLGRDERGRRALQYLKAAGVETSAVIEVEGATDTGFVMLPPSRIPAITVAQDRSRQLDARAIEGAAGTIRQASVVVCQLEAPQESAVAAFRIAREAGAWTILNPAPASELDPDLLSLADVVVPNEHEAAALAGRQASSEELAQELADRWPVQAVVVTAGSEGAYVARDGSSERFPAPEVGVIDTTGAGDAFVGALATQVRDGAEFGEATRFAVRVASMSVTRFGTIPAYPSSEEVSSWG
jgi:ribokinase